MDPYRHIKRALAIIGVVLTTLFIVRAALVPASYGQYGNFRGDHLQEERARDPIHRGSDICGECHDDKLEEKASGRHVTLQCETCHYQPYAGDPNHPEAHPEVSLSPNRSQEACAVCHQYLPPRPDGFPQIKNLSEHIETNWDKVAREGDLTEVNPKALCIDCHNPHDPLGKMEKST